MQVRFGREHAELMIAAMDHTAATAATPELRQYAAETAALMRYRVVRLWGTPAPPAGPAVPVTRRRAPGRRHVPPSVDVAS